MRIALIAGMAVAAGASAQILPGIPGAPLSDGTIAGIDRGPVLWDQQPDPARNAYVDQDFTDFPSFSTFIVSDVSFATNVRIDGVITYYTAGGNWPLGPATAMLNIFDKTGTLPGPGDNPLTGGPYSGAGIVDVEIVAGPNGLEVHATDLNGGAGISLPAGDYWIGLTPILDFGSFGQEFHQNSTSFVGDASAARNPGGGFGVGPDWFNAGQVFGGEPDYDAAITILGVPAPGTVALLGLSGLVAARRRR